MMAFFGVSTVVELEKKGGCLVVIDSQYENNIKGFVYCWSENK
jgi:hypothetical protein